MDLNLEKICEYYKLSEEEHKRIGNSINELMLSGKVSEQRPIAIIDIAPPGSGKTGLNGYALKQFKNDNLIIVNNDELRPFHPKADEIARVYPEYYIKVTNEESKFWTDDLMDKAIECRFNVLYEGTGRKIEIFEKMISKMKGYKIIVRAMAVNELNCLMSIVERYEGQVEEKGWGRVVSTKTFYKAYDDEMLNTINTFEKAGMVYTVEVYIRGESPAEPVKIYSSDTGEFADAGSAVINGREKDRKIARHYFKTNFNKRSLNSTNFTEKNELLEKINNLYNGYSSDVINNNIPVERHPEEAELT
ncbi:MAG TPA: hypothetical protein DEP72_02700 [Clostridiales bacterium]|nr:MAG: hypothetical protein A2Y18_08205 [Clostridiales bacterium GWD2_32_19]HCC07064.1 hypothetical protein [Clostridiales bacterium]